MSLQHFNLRKGFTLIELLMSLVIVVLVTGITAAGLYSFRSHKALEKSAARVVAALEEARINTISSINDTQYGVHFDTDKVIIFEGAAYASDAAANRIVGIDKPATASTTLYGGGAEVVFNRLTGTTDQYGTTTLVLQDASTTVYVIINKTGLIEIQ